MVYNILFSIFQYSWVLLFKVKLRLTSIIHSLHTFPKECIGLNWLPVDFLTCASIDVSVSSLGLTLNPSLCRECTNLEIQVDIETKPSHLCLTSEEDLTPPPGSAAMATASSVEEPQDCSSRRGGALSGSVLGLSPGVSLREGLRDVTLAQPESIRSDLEMSDTQSDDIAELTSDDCDSPHPKSCHLAAGQQPPSCRALTPPEGLHCPADSTVILYV